MAVAEREISDQWATTWQAIRDNTLLAVKDGLFMSKMFPSMNSCAFILECTQGRGRIESIFPEHSMAACAYRGELMGLLAIHLILLAVNLVDPNITGIAKIYSDCLGTLNQVSKLPTDRIPAKYKQSDILKTIMNQCRVLSFQLKYTHLEAHQDDNQDFSTLSRPSQLNIACDLIAKQSIQDLD